MTNVTDILIGIHSGNLVCLWGKVVALWSLISRDLVSELGARGLLDYNTSRLSWSSTSWNTNVVWQAWDSLRVVSLIDYTCHGLPAHMLKQSKPLINIQTRISLIFITVLLVPGTELEFFMNTAMISMSCWTEHNNCDTNILQTFSWAHAKGSILIFK